MVRRSTVSALYRAALLACNTEQVHRSDAGPLLCYQSNRVSRAPTHTSCWELFLVVLQSAFTRDRLQDWAYRFFTHSQFSCTSDVVTKKRIARARSWRENLSVGFVSDIGGRRIWTACSFSTEQQTATLWARDPVPFTFSHGRP